MRSDAHLMAARHVLTGLRKLSLSDEFPAIIEGAYVVAYHFLNGHMHLEGLHPDHKHINSPSHSPVCSESLPRRLQIIWQAFETLENLRLQFVWSPPSFTAKAGVRIARTIDDLEQAGDPSREL